jgi:RNA polymerase sigma-70 factor, ECF subfamily
MDEMNKMVRKPRSCVFFSPLFVLRASMYTVTCFPMQAIQSENQEIVRGLHQRDPELLDSLIERYQHRLFRYLLSLTGNRQSAEDFFQETWLRVLEKGGQYKAKWRFDTWLFSIARHLVIDAARRKRNLSLEDLSDSESGDVERKSADTFTPFEWFALTEEGWRVAAAMELLPLPCREVLLLRFQEDLRLEEIAELVGAPLSTVKSRLYRGMEVLRQHFEGGQA